MGQVEAFNDAIKKTLVTHGALENLYKSFRDLSGALHKRKEELIKNPEELAKIETQFVEMRKSLGVLKETIGFTEYEEHPSKPDSKIAIIKRRIAEIKQDAQSTAAFGAKV